MNLQSLIVPALVTPFVLYVAMLAQRHAGPGAAGLVAALPLQLAIGALGVAASMDDNAVQAFAVVASTFLPAQIGYGLAFTIGMRRGGALAALVSGLVSYSLIVLAIQQVPSLVAIAIGTVAIFIGPRLISRDNFDLTFDDSHAEPNLLVITVLGTLGVLAVIVLVQVGGPTAGAFLAAVPVVSPILSFFLMRSRGREAGAQTMTGMIRGLPSYLVFALSLTFFSKPLGTTTAVGIGLTLCFASAAVSWKVSQNAADATFGKLTIEAGL